MVKTTVYLPDDLKAALGHEALRTHVSEAELIRSAVARMLGVEDRPKPRFGRYSGETLDRRADGRGTCRGVRRALIICDTSGLYAA